MLRSRADLQKLSERFGTQSMTDFTFENIHWEQMKVTLTPFRNNLLID